ncbi:MAG: FISUMP domain-containing protein [Marinoscillum sp.]|uniref:FISUMP domain-containing protein n=1 Tax=Marinoscillum sp. TaxID=2024838 RepID=UPI0033042F98
MKWIAITLLLLVFSQYALAQSSLRDVRDNGRYSTVSVDSKTWMAENLRFNKNHSHFYYLSGREVYYAGSAIASDTLCPKGWRVPTLDEWQALGNSANLIRPKPVGFLESGRFLGFGKQTVYWTSTLDDSLNMPLAVELNAENGEVSIRPASGSLRTACRCVKE